MNYFTILNKQIDKNSDIKFNNKYIHFKINNKLKHWHPYTKNDVTLLILGKPTIELEEWNDFKADEESYITKILLDKYLELDLNSFCKSLNGAFSIILLDKNQNQIILITDKLGMFPIYSNNSDLENLQISSHPDILASNIKKTTLDNISVAEFLKNGFINIPNTYYNEVKVLEHRSSAPMTKGRAFCFRATFSEGSQRSSRFSPKTKAISRQ
jgi:hypothetical protein